jgi:hypothetical protein
MADVKFEISDDNLSNEQNSSEYLLIEWSINKCFTPFPNKKNVKLDDLVTCYVNNLKDVGKVIFVGM